MKKTLQIVIQAGLMVASLFLLTACPPKYPKCETDDHCKEHNEYCVNNFCKQCRVDENCNETDKCMVCGPTNSCVAKEGCCHSDLDCPGGKCWINQAENNGVGECGPLCKSDQDCPQGQECKGDNCVPKEVVQEVQCTLETINFDFDEYVLTQDSRDILKKNADCINKKNQNVLIEGNCDERGTTEYNYQLGQKRAESAKNYLMELNISGSLLKTTSKGEDNPVCTESNEACWSKNRRDEMSFQ